MKILQYLFGSYYDYREIHRKTLRHQALLSRGYKNLLSFNSSPFNIKKSNIFSFLSVYDSLNPLLFIKKVNAAKHLKH